MKVIGLNTRARIDIHLVHSPSLYGLVSYLGGWFKCEVLNASSCVECAFTS
jgi:hypothetical protein